MTVRAESRFAPGIADYAITATVTLFANADPVGTQAAVCAAAAQFIANMAARIQRNIVPSEVIAALSVPGVYSVVLAAPPVERDLTPGYWANCAAVNLTFATGTENM